MKIKIIMICLVMFCFQLSFVSGARNIWETYRTSDEVNSLLKQLAAAHPSDMSYEVIGKSISGENIYLFKVGNPNGGKFMFDGRAHGPEDCGTENGIQFIKWVLESNESDAKRVKERNYLLFIPIINTDSIERQNMRRNYTLSNGTILKVPYGVDLNRNFPTGFGGSGSADPNNDYEYRGLYGGSEPETQAVVNAMKKYNPNIYMNVHCGMQMLNYRSKTNTTLKVLQLITDISSRKGVNTNGYYNPGPGCGGGMVCAEGATWSGGNGWIHETSTWPNLPATLTDYLNIWYPQAFPIYLAMSQAVEKVVIQNSTNQTNTTPTNHAPTHSKPMLRASDYPNNTTNASLTCSNQSTTDSDGDKVVNIREWFMNSNRISRFDNKTTITANETEVGQSWICEVTPYDGKLYGTSLNSSALIIKASPFCGDGACNSNENCTKCSSDCGICPAPSTKITGCTLQSKSWDEDSSIKSAYDLNACFNDPLSTKLTFTSGGKKSIIISIKNGIVNLSAPANWYGSESVTFYAYSINNSNRSASTNKVTLTVNPVADCGDGTCESGESCDSCSADCGACPKKSSGGGGAISKTFEWVCGDWSECADGEQLQVCTQQNTEGTRTNKKNCTMIVVPEILPIEEIKPEVPVVEDTAPEESTETVAEPVVQENSEENILTGNVIAEENEQNTLTNIKNSSVNYSSIIFGVFAAMILSLLIYAGVKHKTRSKHSERNYMAELENYIKEAFKRGHSIEKIKDSLLSVGWQLETIRPMLMNFYNLANPAQPNISADTKIEIWPDSNFNSF